MFWLTPILWSADNLPRPLKQVVMANPITYIVSGYRNAFVYERWFYQDWQYMLYFWGVMSRSWHSWRASSSRSSSPSSPTSSRRLAVE